MNAVGEGIPNGVVYSIAVLFFAIVVVISLPRWLFLSFTVVHEKHVQHCPAASRFCCLELKPLYTSRRDHLPRTFISSTVRPTAGNLNLSAFERHPVLGSSKELGARSSHTLRSPLLLNKFAKKKDRAKIDQLPNSFVNEM